MFFFLRYYRIFIFFETSILQGGQIAFGYRTNVAQGWKSKIQKTHCFEFWPERRCSEMPEIIFPELTCFCRFFATSFFARNLKIFSEPFFKCFFSRFLRHFGNFLLRFYIPQWINVCIFQLDFQKWCSRCQRLMKNTQHSWAFGANIFLF